MLGITSNSPFLFLFLPLLDRTTTPLFPFVFQLQVPPATASRMSSQDSHSVSALHSCTQELLSNYYDFNTPDIDVLNKEPSPVQFLRFVARNRPFVVKRGCSDWPAIQKWNIQYMTNAMRDAEIEVAETPLGNADAALTMHDGEFVFVKPFQRKMSFSHFMTRLLRSTALPDAERVYYSQAQNNNLRDEYSPLAADVHPSISWVDEALGDGMPLDATNLWLGNEKSVTNIHRDNYENIYCQILGQKHFVLFPPIAAAGMNEQWIRSATYQEDFSLKFDEDLPARIPCALWDPDKPDVNKTPFSNQCQLLRVTLDPGDMLYLPSCWYHKVSQSNSEAGINCAVNYWYDQSYDGSAVVTNDFIRKLSWTMGNNHTTKPQAL